jgi:uncharacterized phage-associated protein
VPIEFHFNPEKFTQAVAYVASRCPKGMTKKKLFKLLYFADREHLFRYARPVLNDRYINMDQGPVPTASYDLVKANRKRWSQSVIDMLSRHIEVLGMHIAIREPARTDLLSRSDISVLDEVTARYGVRSADYLSALSHRHKAWLESQRNRRIDYSLFFDDPAVESARELVEYNQPITDISRNAAILRSAVKSSPLERSSTTGTSRATPKPKIAIS